jgi:hypothetical protein
MRMYVQQIGLEQIVTWIHCGCKEKCADQKKLSFQNLLRGAKLSWMVFAIEFSMSADYVCRRKVMNLAREKSICISNKKVNLQMDDILATNRNSVWMIGYNWTLNRLSFHVEIFWTFLGKNFKSSARVTWQSGHRICLSNRRSRFKSSWENADVV